MKKPMTARRTQGSRQTGVFGPLSRRSRARSSLRVRRASARLMACLLVATAPATPWSGGGHPARATLGPMAAGNTLDGKWRWEQAINQPIELGNETTAGTPVTFANLFTGTQGGYPYFPSSIAGSATSCSVTPTGVDLFVEASGASSPCGGTSDSGSGGNGKGDFYIGVAYVVIPPSVTSAVFRVGSAGRNNELHVMFGAPGSAVRVAGGYSAASTFSHTANLGSLPPAYSGSRVAELRVYTHDAAAASGASAEWNLDNVGFTAIPSTNVSTPTGFVNGLVCDFTGARTLSQGGWGNRSTSNPLYSTWFGIQFPGGLKIGGANNSVTFTTASAMANFLPQSGTPRSLTGGNLSNLTRSLKNTLAGQTAALALNLALSPALTDATFAGDVNGYTGTVGELLVAANAALNGTGSPTKALLASTNRNLDYVNLAFEGGIDGGRLQCGASVPAAEITVTSTAPVDPQVGATYTPTATSTSGQTVVITIDPSSSSVCSISSGVITFNAAGTCTVNFNDPGDASYSAATQQQQTITVVAAAATGLTIQFRPTESLQHVWYCPNTPRTDVCAPPYGVPAPRQMDWTTYTAAGVPVQELNIPLATLTTENSPVGYFSVTVSAPDYPYLPAGSKIGPGVGVTCLHRTNVTVVGTVNGASSGDVTGYGYPRVNHWYTGCSLDSGITHAYFYAYTADAA